MRRAVWAKYWTSSGERGQPRIACSRYESHFLRTWLPEGHLAYHVSDLVDGLDLTAFYAPRMKGPAGATGRMSRG